MKKVFIALTIITISFCIISCSITKNKADNIEETPPEGTTLIPAFPQKDYGDPKVGWDYLRYADYVGGGIPYDFFKSLPVGQSSGDNKLDRIGENANIPYIFNVAESVVNGTKIVSGNCFACHGATIDGQFIPGLGNSFSDFTVNQTAYIGLADMGIAARYGPDSPEWKAYAPFSRGVKVSGTHTTLPFKGINSAFMIEQAAVAYHDPVTLEWQDEPVYDIPEERIGSDVPPWWNIRKKNALYYNGMGRGDFTKALMQVTSVAVEDTSIARKINENFVDVLAWMKTIEPPKYPKSIDKDLVAKGEVLFNAKCYKCHGTYGEKETYPNLLVSLEKVKTDPAYANYFLKYYDFSEFANNSWYNEGDNPLYATPSAGYVAPPLDGVWATAPYLHNGSVPTLEDLLNSKQRPTFWRRDFKNPTYDFEKIGWQYTVEEGAIDTQTYNTTISGYGNQGHYYGDKYTPAERKALIEYLKTL